MAAVELPRLSHYGAVHLVSFSYPAAEKGDMAIITRLISGAASSSRDARLESKD